VEVQGAEVRFDAETVVRWERGGGVRQVRASCDRGRRR
jgi:hypothetical protein